MIAIKVCYYRVLSNGFSPWLRSQIIIRKDFNDSFMFCVYQGFQVAWLGMYNPK